MQINFSKMMRIFMIFVAAALSACRTALARKMDPRGEGAGFGEGAYGGVGFDSGDLVSAAISNALLEPMDVGKCMTLGALEAPTFHPGFDPSAPMLHGLALQFGLVDSIFQVPSYTGGAPPPQTPALRGSDPLMSQYGLLDPRPQQGGGAGAGDPGVDYGLGQPTNPSTYVGFKEFGGFDAPLLTDFMLHSTDMLYPGTSSARYDSQAAPRGPKPAALRHRQLTQAGCLADEDYSLSRIFDGCQNKERFLSIPTRPEDCHHPKYTPSQWWGPEAGIIPKSRAMPILGSSEDTRDIDAFGNTRDYGIDEFCKARPEKPNFFKFQNPGAGGPAHTQCLPTYQRLLMTGYDQCDNLLWLNCLIAGWLPRSTGDGSVLLVTAPKNVITADPATGGAQSRAVDEYCYLSAICGNRDELWAANDEDVWKCTSVVVGWADEFLRGHDKGRERTRSPVPAPRETYPRNAYDDMF